MFSDSMKTNELEKARFVESRTGNPMLLDKDGYIFFSNKKGKNWTYWKCKETDSRKCPARAYTKDIYVAKWSNQHNHGKISQN